MRFGTGIDVRVNERVLACMAALDRASVNSSGGLVEGTQGIQGIRETLPAHRRPVPVPIRSVRPVHEREPPLQQELRRIFVRGCVGRRGSELTAPVLVLVLVLAPGPGPWPWPWP